MDLATVHITDNEFAQLIGANMMAFAARLRAETVAYDLKRRIAAVADDLRHWVAAGELSDPKCASRIANAFDHLANEVGNEIDRDHTTRWADSDLTDSDIQAYLDCSINEYELEAWHAQAHDCPGKGIEGR